jgi:hypothetical protein
MVLNVLIVLSIFIMGWELNVYLSTITRSILHFKDSFIDILYRYVRRQYWEGDHLGIGFFR